MVEAALILAVAFGVTCAMWLWNNRGRGVPRPDYSSRRRPPVGTDTTAIWFVSFGVSMPDWRATGRIRRA